VIRENAVLTRKSNLSANPLMPTRNLNAVAVTSLCRSADADVFCGRRVCGLKGYDELRGIATIATFNGGRTAAGVLSSQASPCWKSERRSCTSSRPLRAFRPRRSHR
jgi:hypothetical protein